MDQSKSNSATATPAHTIHAPLPKRHLNIEFLVGLFTLFGVGCAGWLAVGLGGLQVFNHDSYDIYGEFDNVSGLKTGASIEIAGVPIGEVASIELKDPMAKVVFRINNRFRIKDDDIAAIRTKGIIGDRYVKISRGGSDQFVSAGGTMTETESVVDIEDIIGKIVHSLTGEKDEEKKKEADKKE